jgi:hypothetical protein
MTRATKARAQRRRQAPPPPKRSPWVERGLIGLVAAAVVLVAAGVWRLSDDGRGTSAAGAGPVHVHGLGIDPADNALFIATHTGLFRVGERDSKAVRVGGNHQDTMGFTVVGENRFLGSGHPDLRTDLPPLLGLIESTDGGASWETISLLGEADFHVLRSADERVYGYDPSRSVLKRTFSCATQAFLHQPIDERVRPVRRAKPGRTASNRSLVVEGWLASVPRRRPAPRGRIWPRRASLRDLAP